MKLGPLKLTVYSCQFQLVQPYILSFGTLNHIDTFYVTAEYKGLFGVGEVTPLPGYSEESAASVIAELDLLGSGPPMDIDQVIEVLAVKAPILASGVACAIDTLDYPAIWGHLENSIPLAGLCGGATPKKAASEAIKLCNQGYKVLKLKIGTDRIDQDIQRVQAIAHAIPSGVELRLDANQALSFEGAMALCAGIRDLPVTYVEQPFTPEAWDITADLTAATSVPIMMDESIWHAEDIAHASIAGAKFIKLKLCKHRGIKDTLTLISLATDMGMGVIFGNGVQSSLGNHLEAKIYESAKLTSVGEFNGFSKIDSPLMPQGLSVESGVLVDNGIDPSKLAYPTDQKIFQIDLMT